MKTVTIQQQLVVNTSQVMPFQPRTVAATQRSTHATEHQISSIDEAMMMKIYQYGRMNERRLGELKADRDFLQIENIRLKNDIVEMRDSLNEEWATHIKKVQEQVETIYNKFKTLDQEMEADHLSVSKVAVCDFSPKTLSDFSLAEKMGKAQGIRYVFGYYRGGVRAFYKEVEDLYLQLPKLSERALEEVQKVKETTIAIATAKQEERALIPASGLFFNLEQQLEEEMQPVRKEIDSWRAENHQLEIEKMQLKEMHTQAFRVYSSYLKHYLTLPSEWRGFDGRARKFKTIHQHYEAIYSDHKHPREEYYTEVWMSKNEKACNSTIKELSTKIVTRFEAIVPLIRALTQS